MNHRPLCLKEAMFYFEKIIIYSAKEYLKKFKLSLILLKYNYLILNISIINSRTLLSKIKEVRSFSCSSLCVFYDDLVLFGKSKE